jgi:hypothetical protein
VDGAAPGVGVEDGVSSSTEPDAELVGMGLVTLGFPRDELLGGVVVWAGDEATSDDSPATDERTEESRDDGMGVSP